MHVCFCCMVCNCGEKKHGESEHAYARYAIAHAWLVSPSFSHYAEENESCAKWPWKADGAEHVLSLIHI